MGRVIEGESHRGAEGDPLAVWVAAQVHHNHEHIIRDDSALSRVRDYIRENPAAWDKDPENPALAGQGPRG